MQREPAPRFRPCRGINRLAANPTKTLATQPEHHEELTRLADLISEGRRDRSQQGASEALVTSLIATGTLSEVWASIDRYLAGRLHPRGYCPLPSRTRPLRERPLRPRAGALTLHAGNPEVGPTRRRLW